MSEPIRLIIWDLDETFWDGTLTEGGMTWREDHAEIVRALAKRGIVSSICSKNDPEQVRAVLDQHGMWDSFVFASINWAPKGPRLAALIEAAQLRAPTVLFIDDNAMNRAEALHHVAGLQVADVAAIAGLLENPLCQGKDDSGLTRLAQYRLLARRTADARAHGADNRAFLIASDIRVSIEHDLSAHLDRAIELINRTNQLNFAKARLPENPAAARAELAELLSDYNVQAGLIRVRDVYGDHGFCGLYILRSGALAHRLLQFCFSCRILGMGVEAWLYGHLGQPELKVAPPVLAGLKDSAPADWITLEVKLPAGRAPAAQAVIGTLYARGGCDLHAVTHYFDGVCRNVRRDFNFARGGVSIRLDHSMFIRHARQGVPAESLPALADLGYRPEDFAHGQPPAEARAWLLSFMADAQYPLYRHRATGVMVPATMATVAGTMRDLTMLRPDEVVGIVDTRCLARLQAEFDYAGTTGEADFIANLTMLLNDAPAETPVYILLGSEYTRDSRRDNNFAQQDGADGEADGQPDDICGGHAVLPSGGFPAHAGEAAAAAWSQAEDTQLLLMARYDHDARRAAPPGTGREAPPIFTEFETSFAGLHERRRQAALAGAHATPPDFPGLGGPRLRPRMHQLNSWIRAQAACRPNVTLLALTDFVRDKAEFRTEDHLDRMVYYRVFQHILQQLTGHR